MKNLKACDFMQLISVNFSIKYGQGNCLIDILYTESFCSDLACSLVL